MKRVLQVSFKIRSELRLIDLDGRKFDTCLSQNLGHGVPIFVAGEVQKLLRFWLLTVRQVVEDATGKPFACSRGLTAGDFGGIRGFAIRSTHVGEGRCSSMADYVKGHRGPAACINRKAMGEP